MRTRPGRPPVAVMKGSAVLLAAIAVLAVSACAGAPDQRGGEVERATIVAEHDCLAPNIGGWALPQGDATAEHPAAPEPGRLPEGFAPVLAYRCNLMAAIEDQSGRWSAVTVDRLEGDLTPLIAALAEPDDHGGFGLACSADEEIITPLWLVDTAGRAVLAHYPRDACGKTKPATRDAMDRLTIVDTETIKHQLLESAAALAAGCPMTAVAPASGLPLAFVPGPAITGPDGITVVPMEAAPLLGSDQVDGMRWCRYVIENGGDRADALPGDDAVTGLITLRDGVFVAGGLLGSAQAALVMDSAHHDADPAECGSDATEFVIVEPVAPGAATRFALELDGCRTIYAAGAGSPVLPEGLVALFE